MCKLKVPTPQIFVEFASIDLAPLRRQSDDELLQQLTTPTSARRFRPRLLTSAAADPGAHPQSSDLPASADGLMVE